jgi:transposase
MKVTVAAGVDVSAASFAVTVIDHRDETHYLGKVYANNLQGIGKCVSDIAAEGIDVNEVVFCLEHTGVYCETLCFVLTQRGYTVALADPEKVRRSADDPKHKEDLLDSVRIAEYAGIYSKRLTPWRPNDDSVEMIGQRLIVREQMVKQRTALKNQLGMARRKWVRDPVTLAMLETQIQHLRDQINSLEGSMLELVQASPALAHGYRLLVSIPCVGFCTAMNLIVVTRGFTVKRTYRRLAAYLGVAPRRRKSGTSFDMGNHSRGYGPSLLRKALHMSARSAKHTVAHYRVYFEQKKAQGKNGRLIINNLINKQLRVICAVLNTGIPYNKNYVSIPTMVLTKP